MLLGRDDVNPNLPDNGAKQHSGGLLAVGTKKGSEYYSGGAT